MDRTALAGLEPEPLIPLILELQTRLAEQAARITELDHGLGNSAFQNLCGEA